MIPATALHLRRACAITAAVTLVACSGGGTEPAAATAAPAAAMTPRNEG